MTRVVTGLLITAALLLLSPQPAEACECIGNWSRPKPSPDRIIAVGSVVALRRLETFGRIVAVELFITEAFQNATVGKRVVVYTDIGVGYACEAMDFRLGHAYLFWTRPTRDGVPDEWKDAGRSVSSQGHVVGNCTHGGARLVDDAEQQLLELRAKP